MISPGYLVECLIISPAVVVVAPLFLLTTAVLTLLRLLHLLLLDVHALVVVLALVSGVRRLVLDLELVPAPLGPLPLLPPPLSVPALAPGPLASLPVPGAAPLFVSAAVAASVSRPGPPLPVT